MKTKLDFLGQPIQPPCRVVYPTRRGSDLAMNTLLVERCLEDRIVGFNSDKRRVSIRRWDLCVVVETNAHDDRTADYF